MSKSRCYTCLELDRKLTPLKDPVKYIFKLLCPEMFLKHPSMHLICWECECIVNKIKRFQNRLQISNKVLNASAKSKKMIPEGLSSLTQTSVETLILALPSMVIPKNLPMPPENLPNLPNELKLPHNALKLPSNDISSEVLHIDTEIKIERESEETCINDFDELIKPTKIQQVPIACESLHLPSQENLNPTMKSISTEVPPVKPETEKIVTTVTNYIPQIVFINKQKQQVALRGSREAVKVTVGETNLAVTGKKSPVLVKNNERRPGKRKVLSKVLLPTSKREKLVLRPNLCGPHVPISKTVDESRPKRCEEDEAKLIILNRNELNELRKTKRANLLYLKSLYKCETCIDWFQTQHTLDKHLMKHNEARGNYICEICKVRFADEIPRDEHFKQHFIIYECLQCPLRHTERLKISEHVRKIHEESSFPCSKCDAEFNTFKEKRSHMVHNHKEESIYMSSKPCQVCNKIFSTSVTLKSHMLTVHKTRTK